MVSQIERKYPPKGEFVAVETAKLHFLTRKEASDIESRENAPIVLIHGSSGSSADMELAFLRLFPLILTYTRLTALVSGGARPNFTLLKCQIR